MQQDIRIAPAVAARLVGAGIALLGVLVLALVVVGAVTSLPTSVVVLVAALGVFLLGALGLYLLNVAWVLRITEQGYRVRFVRGAGVTRARWLDVEDAVASYVADTPCVVLRLKDGGSTTVPVTVLAIDRERLVTVLQDALERGRGLKRLR